MSLPIHGPVPRYERTPDERAFDMKLLESHDPVDRALGAAFQAGCLVRGLYNRDEPIIVFDREVFEVQIFRQTASSCALQFGPLDKEPACNYEQYGGFVGQGETPEEQLHNGLIQVLESRSGNGLY